MLEWVFPTKFKSILKSKAKETFLFMYGMNMELLPYQIALCCTLNYAFVMSWNLIFISPEEHCYKLILLSSHYECHQTKHQSIYLDPRLVGRSSGASHLDLFGKRIIKESVSFGATNIFCFLVCSYRQCSHLSSVSQPRHGEGSARESRTWESISFFQCGCFEMWSVPS